MQSRMFTGWQLFISETSGVPNCYLSIELLKSKVGLLILLKYSTLLSSHRVLHERGSMKGNKVVTYPVVKYAIYAICEIRVLI